MLRALPEPNTSGGTAGFDSFMMQLPMQRSRAGGSVGDSAAAARRRTRNIIAHEMSHGWVGGIAGRGNTQWYGEGANTYMTARLLLTLGLAPVESYAEELTALGRDYYPNPFRNVSADSAATAFWSDKNGERLPYVRGALYFFDVNARIRKATGGRRSLDDLFLELWARRARGERLTTETWVGAVARELGPAAAAEFDSVVVRGVKTVELQPDALGPCFTRGSVRAVVPDFTFDRRFLPKQLVTSLVAGSAAERAGLRQGDEVVGPFDSGLLTSGSRAPVTLDVVREGRTLRISYTPDPLHVTTYEWSRAAGVPDDVCRRG